MRSAFVALSLIALAVPAAADTIGQSTPGWNEVPRRKYESSQWFALEIKFTPYTPHIDQSAGLASGQTPFADLFNNQDPVKDMNGNIVSGNKGKQPGYRLLTSVEFDVQFLRRAYGNFGVGITTGFYRRTTHSFQLEGNNTSCSVPNCTRSGDETGLNILPLSALFVYRFDLLANRYHVPLVPYFKIGLAYYIWWIDAGNGFGSIASFGTDRGANKTGQSQGAYGGTFGFVLHPGLAIQLDFIERAVAKTLDAELGINHTYLFCELNYANVNGFGAGNKLNLGDTMLNAGMAFEF
jgi:hypothetical protein